jgi:hypothetical protein
MKAFGGSSGTRNPGTSFLTRPRGAVLLFGLLLLLTLLPLAAGCSIVEDLTVSAPPTALDTTATTAQVVTATTEALAEATPTTAFAQTTTTAAGETTTTLPDTTTTTEGNVLAPVTTSTTVATTDTTETGAQATDGAGTVLYEISDWSTGASGWAAAGQWKTAGGMLVTDGSSDSFAIAPVDLTGHPDYVVECEVQILDPKAETDILLMARMINGAGYWGGFDGSARRMVVGYGTDELGGAGFVLDSNWHTYRLEVRGNMVKIFFEQAEVGRAVDNRALEPGTVGIYCGSGQINVRSFRVIALQ